jgi:hypothetical protein
MDEDVPQRAPLGELTAQKTSKPTTKTRRTRSNTKKYKIPVWLFFVSLRVLRVFVVRISVAVDEKRAPSAPLFILTL